MSNLVENLLPRFGQNTDGTLNTRENHNEAIATLHTGTLPIATTELPGWSCGQYPTKALFLTLVGGAVGESVFTLYARGTLQEQALVHSNITSGSETVLYTETVAAGATVRRWVDLSAFPLPHLVLAVRVATTAAGAGTSIRAYGRGA